MIAKDLISYELSPLHKKDTGEEAITMMNIFHVKHLPIVEDGKFVGLISEDDILNHDMESAIESYNLGMTRAFALENEHVFEVMSKLAHGRLTIIPILDKGSNYLGLVTMENLIQYYAKSFSFSEPGSILVISTSKPEYSLVEISKIVESENAAILSTFLTLTEDSNEVQITLKINKQDINTISTSFLRYDYKIVASFSEYEYIDDLKERYDSLMSYLNV